MPAAWAFLFINLNPLSLTTPDLTPAAPQRSIEFTERRDCETLALRYADVRGYVLVYPHAPDSWLACVEVAACAPYTTIHVTPR